MTWNPTWKAKASKLRRIRLKGDRKGRYRSFFRSFPYEVHSWYQYLASHLSHGTAGLLGLLWYPRTRYCFDENNEMFSQSDMEQFVETAQRNPVPEFAEATPCLLGPTRSVGRGRGEEAYLRHGKLGNPAVVEPTSQVVDGCSPSPAYGLNF